VHLVLQIRCKVIRLKRKHAFVICQFSFLKCTILWIYFMGFFRSSITVRLEYLKCQIVILVISKLILMLEKTVIM